MTDRRQAGTVILRETAKEARKAPEVPENTGNRRVLDENGGFGMLVGVHHLNMPRFSSFLTFPAGAVRAEDCWLEKTAQ